MNNVLNVLKSLCQPSHTEQKKPQTIKHLDAFSIYSWFCVRCWKVRMFLLSQFKLRSNNIQSSLNV